jgi:ubiquinone/menaquinone biosynthesis C-methylase UbiE
LLPQYIHSTIRDSYLNLNSPSSGLSPTQYWTEHHVQSPQLSTPDEYKKFTEWRNKRYLGYSELLPLKGHDGKVIVDYGCGPGIELAGLGIHNKYNKLYGVDISTSALEKAKHRCDTLGVNCELIPLSQEIGTLPIDSNSVDLIHCSGVLHHTPDPISIMKEFKRILKDGGKAQIMIYNYDSVFVHLYIAYLQMIRDRKRMFSKDIYQGMDKKLVFKIHTDGLHCPISHCWKVDEFIDMVREAGMKCVFKGSSPDIDNEMKILPLRFDAISDYLLDPESRDFLYDLSFDDRGIPVYQGRTAGINGCFELT